MTPDTYTIEERMLGVGNGHILYIHDWGNQHAEQTFLFLHGGPGSGCSDSHKMLFDGERDHVIFFDQRGAGRSTPAGSLKANTTQDLIADISAVLGAFKVDSAIAVGGSWGSCLALAYALDNPARISAMVLRGIFSGSQTEIDHLDRGQFRNFFPDVWEKLIEQTPAEHRDDPVRFHVSRALGPNAKAAKASAYAYSELESSLLALDDRHKAGDFETYSPTGNKVEIHYLANRCFLPDGYILDNAHKLTMPIWLIQGRYDMICPPVTAYKLHKRLPSSQLTFTTAGHTASDRANFDLLRTIIANFTEHGARR